MGIRTEQELEERYMEGILAKLEVCQNSVFEKEGEKAVQKFDIEKEGEEAVKKWIRNWRSREKIESHYFPATGKTEYYVVLLAMRFSKVAQDFQKLPKLAQRLPKISKLANRPPASFEISRISKISKISKLAGGIFPQVLIFLKFLKSTSKKSGGSKKHGHF